MRLLEPKLKLGYRVFEELVAVEAMLGKLLPHRT
jgi:hypothetical protein